MCVDFFVLQNYVFFFGYPTFFFFFFLFNKKLNVNFATEIKRM